MARGKPLERRMRAKRFEEEIVSTADMICEELELKLDKDGSEYQKIKASVGKFVKRLIDSKLIKEQEFYLGDWVFVVKDPHGKAMEIVDINYKLKTARIRCKSEGEIWIKFDDIVKDQDQFLF